MNSEQHLQHGIMAWLCFHPDLRQSWNKDLFMNKTGGPSINDKDETRHSESVQESFGVTVEKLDQVLTDPCFWGRVHLIRSWPATALFFLTGWVGSRWALQ